MLTSLHSYTLTSTASPSIYTCIPHVLPRRAGQEGGLAALEAPVEVELDGEVAGLAPVRPLVGAVHVGLEVLPRQVPQEPGEVGSKIIGLFD